MESELLKNELFFFLCLTISKEMSWKIFFGVGYTIKNELENNFSCFIFFQVY
jgi:hypothetical protein